MRFGNTSTISGPSRAGADIGLQIRFFKVREVDLVAGSMSLKIWYRLSWTDERLSWDPEEHNGITQVPLAEKEVWQPDIGHYNAMVGVQNTLESSVIIVSHTGSIYWSRPGMLEVMCK